MLLATVVSDALYQENNLRLMTAALETTLEASTRGLLDHKPANLLPYHGWVKVSAKRQAADENTSSPLAGNAEVRL